MAKCVGDLEKSCSVIWRKLIRRFSVKKCVSDLEKSLGDFGEDRSATTLEIWRNLFGEIVWRFGEIVRRFWGKPCGVFILEIIMEYCEARQPYVEIKT